jgi:hypothetical protein
MAVEGFYGIQFRTPGDFGAGVLVLETGIIVGVDQAGVEYDGTYSFNAKSGALDFDLRITVPQGVALVTGLTVPPGTQIPIKASVPANLKKGQTHRFEVDVAGKKVTVDIQCLRVFS